MPTYSYRRPDGTTFEARQKMSDDPLTECPETGEPCERVIAAPAVVLADGGVGWASSGYAARGD